MAAIENALVSLLKADDALNARVSGRVFPAVIKQGIQLPSVVFQRYATNRQYGAGGSVSLLTANFQITVWAESYTEAAEIGDLIRAAANGYTGTVSDIAIDHIEILDEGDNPSLAAENESIDRYGRYVDTKIFFTE